MQRIWKLLGIFRDLAKSLARWQGSRISRVAIRITEPHQAMCFTDDRQEAIGNCMESSTEAIALVISENSLRLSVSTFTPGR